MPCASSRPCGGWRGRKKRRKKRTVPNCRNGPQGRTKGTVPLCRNGPQGARHIRGLSPFSALSFPPHTLLRAAATWVRLSGVLAVLLGLKAAFFPYGHEERLWAAAAIAIASSAGATMAVWCRREGWAFSAALGVNLAASLVVWYVHREVGSFGEWWLHLVEANVIASATVALAWLAAQKRLYQGRDVALRNTPFLATQVDTSPAGMIAMLAMPVFCLAGSRLLAGLAGPARRRGGLARAAVGRRGRRVVSRPGLAGQADPRCGRRSVGHRRARACATWADSTRLPARKLARLPYAE